MLSDLRVLDAPLDKEACAVCGLVRRHDHSTTSLFDLGYALYDHAPGAAREDARQQAYAEWLSARVATVPRSILDLGCGNGSLLLALGSRWPGARLRGLDPSPESVGRARDAGIDAQRGSVGAASVDRADLVVSVNVIEHVADPRPFLRSIASLLAPGGTALLVCPDGAHAWLELLFADHLWSFSPAHMRHLAAEAGLEVVDRAAAPSGLGLFQMIRLERAKGALPGVSIVTDETAELTSAKHNYLRAWSQLEGELLVRSREAPSLVCFGMGEAAALLRAYAPVLWSRVKLCAVDRPEGEVFAGVPVVDYTDGRFEWPVVLGVRPDAQAGVARRLEDNGCSVIRWDDRIAA